MSTEEDSYDRNKRDWELGRRMLRRREALGLTQEQVEERTAALGLRVKANTISRLEKGRTSTFAHNIGVIARALGCSYDYLVGWTEGPTEHVTLQVAGEGETRDTRVWLQSRKRQSHLVSVP
jgi:transcriptional regulator with XRE-family HTH domain